MTTYNWAKKEHKTDKNWAETILLKAPLDAYHTLIPSNSTLLISYETSSGNHNEVLIRHANYKINLKTLLPVCLYFKNKPIFSTHPQFHPL